MPRRSMSMVDLKYSANQHRPDRSDDMKGTNNSPPDKDEIAESGLVPQLAMMSRGLWVSPTRNTVAVTNMLVDTSPAGRAAGR
jgi:hypothetical protein